MLYKVRIVDAETGRESLLGPPQNESISLQRASQTAENLADSVASEIDVEADDAYIETDGQRRFTVWRLIRGDASRKAVAYVVEVDPAQLI